MKPFRIAHMKPFLHLAVCEALYIFAQASATRQITVGSTSSYPTFSDFSFPCFSTITLRSFFGLHLSALILHFALSLLFLPLFQPF